MTNEEIKTLIDDPNTLCLTDEQLMENPPANIHLKLEEVIEVDWKVRAEKLQAENSHLRAALELIVEGRDAGRSDGLPESCPIHDNYAMFAIARCALGTMGEIDWKAHAEAAERQVAAQATILAQILANRLEHDGRVCEFRADGTCDCSQCLAHLALRNTAATAEAYEKRIRADERRKVLEEAIACAFGCKDYGGGYRGDPEKLDIYHHGIETVARTLKSRRDNPTDTQSRAVLGIGREELAALDAERKGEADQLVGVMLAAAREWRER